MSELPQCVYMQNDRFFAQIKIRGDQFRAPLRDTVEAAKEDLLGLRKNMVTVELVDCCRGSSSVTVPQRTRLAKDIMPHTGLVMSVAKLLFAPLFLLRI